MSVSFLQDGPVSSEKDPPVFLAGCGKAARMLELTRGRELGISLLRCRTSFNPLVFSSVLLPFFIESPHYFSRDSCRGEGKWSPYLAR